MPDALDTHWLKDYAELLRSFDDSDIDSQRKALDRATAYYRANRDVMDAGAAWTWDHVPLEPGEISALQHAMNIFILEGEDVFDSECQNSPKRNEVATYLQLTESVKTRRNGLARNQVPDETQVSVFGVDVHPEILYWSRACSLQNFTGSIVSYGTFPEQPTDYFSHSKIRRKLTDLFLVALLKKRSCAAWLNCLPG